MGMMKEFKEFAMRGNVVDLAVGVVIGGAFGKIVSALVEKIIMPLTGFLTQGKSVADLKYQLTLPEGIAEGIKPAEIGYGAFIQATIDFLIVAFAVFLMVKLINSMRARFEKQPEAAEASPPPEDIALLREIRDALQRNAPRRAE